MGCVVSESILQESVFGEKGSKNLHERGDGNMYLDPSFGGMVLQIIVAAIAGGGAIIFGMRRKFKALSKKNKDAPAAEYNNGQAPDDGEIVDMLMDEEN